MEYLFQFAVLIFTAYVWWLARRDLARRSGEVYGPATQEWERLQEAVQTLIADLERRATEAEKRAAAAERRMAEAAGHASASPPMPLSDTSEKPETEPEAPVAPPLTIPYAEAEWAAHEERYAPVYALADAGLTDTADIARRTGLGQGEIALVLGLYARPSSH